MYLLALYARYEWIGNLIDWRSQGPWHRRLPAKAAVLRVYGLKARQLGELNGSVVMRIAEAETWTEARAVIEQHKDRPPKSAGCSAWPRPAWSATPASMGSMTMAFDSTEENSPRLAQPSGGFTPATWAGGDVTRGT